MTLELTYNGSVGTTASSGIARDNNTTGSACGVVSKSSPIYQSGRYTYEDFDPSAHVVLTSGTGETIGTGDLGIGRTTFVGPEWSCTWTVDLGPTQTADFYTVTVAGIELATVRGGQGPTIQVTFD